MNRHPSRAALPRAHVWADRAYDRLQHFLHIEAVSGIVLLLAAAVALIWANSAYAPSYHALWHAPVTFGVGDLISSQSLHFWINDGLMTLFFLVVGMEIRREIHDGALSNMRQAALPIAAALGGVIVPALIYVAFNPIAPRLNGWAVPTATDIAFAVGVLALLGRSLPGTIRVFLLALAIIDDIIAVLIIALFYSGGLAWEGFAVAGVGLALVIALQRIGVGSAWAYVVPGAITWTGLLLTGAHPTLAGVVLGLMTPVFAKPLYEPAARMLQRIGAELAERPDAISDGEHRRALHVAKRELAAPALRVQQSLHPWVAFGVMPIFALANAGVSFGDIDLAGGDTSWVVLGVGLALVLGKPVGVLAASAIALRLGAGRLPAGMDWRGLLLVGLLAGVGFTMSIFIAMLAFDDASLLGAAKLGVLLGSLCAALLGLGWGALLAWRVRRAGSAG